LIRETDESYVIECEMVSFITLVNVLPVTIVKATKDFCTDQELCKILEDQIRGRIISVTTDTRVIYKPQPVNTAQIALLVKQLVYKGIIQKFIQLESEGRYLCVSKSIPLLIESVNGFLNCSVVNRWSFDIDEGFFGENIPENLQRHFCEWKKHNDMNIPIFEPNVLIDPIYH
jgi:hypothetical protein